MFQDEIGCLKNKHGFAERFGTILRRKSILKKFQTSPDQSEENQTNNGQKGQNCNLESHLSPRRRTLLELALCTCVASTPIFHRLGEGRRLTWVASATYFQCLEEACANLSSPRLRILIASATYALSVASPRRDIFSVSATTFYFWCRLGDNFL